MRVFNWVEIIHSCVVIYALLGAESLDLPCVTPGRAGVLNVT